MGDPAESNKRLTPDWQHEEAASDSTEDCKKASETADVTEPPPPRASLIEQASNFLKDEEIRDASRERKISFLRSKGLTDEEVYRLLEIPFDGIKAEVQDQEAAPEQALSQSPSSDTQNLGAPSFQSSSTTSPLRDTPPIITYPEFLLHSEKPPPLITASRLINTFYLFSGTAAAIYGTSKYLVQPMLDSLTSARHDFFLNTQTNLDDMLDKLENNVSIIPIGPSKDKMEGEEDASSDDSIHDATSFFNRTIGTQTSPAPSTTPASSDPSSAPATTLASLHQRTLESLHTSLSALVPSDEESSDNDKTRDQIYLLRNYLDRLQYPMLQAPGLADSKEDAVNKFKMEIRSMKGALLNAKNFPSSNTQVRGSRGRVGE
ncbi:MAG: hypothetical protein LQ337_000796 [Flavoplaca oasis]|nr:MAG: hypothetical protein LQ337_000796 [Flavoplaca oasis]